MTWLIVAIAGLVIGAVAGAIFLGGLWLTTQRLATTSRPGLLLLVSLLGRSAAMSFLLVTLARTHPGLLIGALVGFTVVRMVLTRRVAIEKHPSSRRSRALTRPTVGA